MTAPVVTVTVAWAAGAVQELVPVALPAGATVADALAVSGLLARHGIDAATLRVGIFSRPAKAGDPVADGDRVEIYRPLQVSPGDARRLRAEAAARPRK